MSNTQYANTGDTIRITEDPSMNLIMSGIMSGFTPDQVLGKEFEVVGTFDSLLENPEYRAQAEDSFGTSDLTEASANQPDGLVFIDLGDGGGPLGITPNDYSLVNTADTVTA